LDKSRSSLTFVLMKTKFPSLIRFNDFKELFNNVDFELLIKMRKSVKLETEEMKLVRKEIINTLDTNSELFNQLESLMVRYKRLFIIENLDLYTSITNQVDMKSSNNNTYRTAKVMFPQVGGEDLGVRVSLGRCEDVKKLKKGPSVEDFEKIRNALLSRM
jgi:hypothetical protein